MKRKIICLLLTGLPLPALAGDHAAQARDRIAPAQLAQGPAGRALGLDRALQSRALSRAQALSRLNSLIVARDGKPLVEYARRRGGLDRLVSVKSISKSIVSALVGIAIERGVLKSADQPIAPFFADKIPAGADRRIRLVTVGNLLSMQAGLERTSGRNYGRWVRSKDWVRFALSRPFVDDPGGPMLYSTGSTHLLSALLTRASGRSTFELARDWLARPLGISIPPWQRDPQGIYFGGNNMLLSPRALLRFGELYRNRGIHEGRRILPESWIRESWTPRTRSRFTAHEYGYGWFMTELCGHRAHYARGFGGQYLYVVPTLAMTIVITSDPAIHSREGGYRYALKSLLEDDLVPAALRNDGVRPAAGSEDGEACRV